MGDIQASVADLLSGSSVLQQARAEREERIAERRRQLHAQLALLDRKWDRELPPLDREVAKAAGRMAAAEQALEAARSQHMEATARRRNFSIDYDIERQAIDAELRELADAQIADFIAAMRQRIEDARRLFSSETVGAKTGTVTGTKTEFLSTNGPALEAWRTSALEAIAAAEAMQLEANPTSVAARLSKLAASVADPRTVPLTTIERVRSAIFGGGR